MFIDQAREGKFWRHLYDCRKCRAELRRRFPEEIELLEEDFWKEVKNYLFRQHPDILVFRERIYRQAQLDLLGKVPEQVMDEFVKRYRFIEYHLLVCGKCSRRYETIYDRLRVYNNVVAAAHLQAEVRAFEKS